MELIFFEAIQKQWNRRWSTERNMLIMFTGKALGWVVLHAE